MIGRSTITRAFETGHVKNTLALQTVFIGVAVCLICPFTTAAPEAAALTETTKPVVGDTNQELYRMMFEGNVIDAVQYQHALEHGRLPGNGQLSNAAISVERQGTWNQLHSQGVISAEELVQMLGKGKMGDLSPADIKAFEDLAPVYEPSHAKRLKYEIRRKHIAVDMIRFRETTGTKWERWKEEADERAKREGLPISFEGSKLVRFNEHGIPVYITVQNRNAGDSIWSDEVRPNGASPFGLTGTNITVAVFDVGAIRETHQEFGGRVRECEVDWNDYYHKTAVIGTIAAQGVESNAIGMASSVNVDAYVNGGALGKLAVILQTNLLCQISNHSYTRLCGWANWGGSVRWMGDVNVSTNEDIAFGQYTSTSRDIDAFAYDAKYHLLVYSAGNEGSGLGDYWSGTPHQCMDSQGAWGTRSDHHGNDGNYMQTDTHTPYSVAKNSLSVGNAIDAPGGYSTNTPSEWRSGSSSQGLTDDWRAKPDILANGTALYTTDDAADTDYKYVSGTSFSAPCVSGSLALIQDLHQRIYGTNAPMLASTLKAITLHSAVNRKDDYSHSFAEGWGIMNTLASAWVVSNNASWVSLPHIKEVALQDGEMIEFDVQATGTNGLTFTMVWTDPEGDIPPYELDCTNSVLVNDLDLRVIAPNGETNYPFAYVEDATNINLSFKQVNADNSRDNVERVHVEDTTNGLYTARVTHKGSLSNGVQEVSIVITGNTPTNAPDFCITSIGTVGSNDVAELTWPGVVGGLYAVEMSTNLLLHPAGWTTGSVISANLEIMTSTNTPSAGENRFYRIRRFR
ncbi:MAG: S8 family serine peptidase [Verrucomicrobia bacterium]|jgi:hypothetical protein|nr:S8 family serine peptidase [Verrucomicrobiota bacterium]MBT7065032.1 S8 family serine peptidase [Verrucomicrobiota bacterium]